MVPPVSSSLNCAVAAAAVPDDANSKDELGCACSFGVLVTSDADKVLRRDEENGKDCSSAGFNPGIRALMRIRVCPSCNALDMASVAKPTVDSTELGTQQRGAS